MIKVGECRHGGYREYYLYDDETNDYVYIGDTIGDDEEDDFEG